MAITLELLGGVVLVIGLAVLREATNLAPNEETIEMIDGSLELSAGRLLSR